MYDLNNKHSIAAALASEGCHVLPLPSQRVAGTDYLFYFSGVLDISTMLTTDIDFRIRVEQLPRNLASLVVSYLRAK